MYVVLHPDGTLTEHPDPATSAAVRDAVGPFDLFPIQAHLYGYVNDDGLRHQDRYALNITGGAVVAALGAYPHVFAGPIVVTAWNPSGSGPEIRDLTYQQAAMVRRTHAAVTQVLSGGTVEAPAKWRDAVRLYADTVRNVVEET